MHKAQKSGMHHKLTGRLREQPFENIQTKGEMGGVVLLQPWKHFPLDLGLLCSRGWN